MTSPAHFLDLDDVQRPALEALIVRAHAFKKGVPDAGVRLRGRTILGMFFEPSTRTANSFALAAQQLGAHWLAFDTGGSSMSKGETLEDTARTIAALGADAIVVRHQESGFPHALARYFSGAVINAGDGWHAHPTQGVLDAMTLVEELGSLEGRRFVIAGDIRHSRVARSSARALWLLGARVTLCGPPLLLTLSAPGWGFADLATDLDACLPTADALMLLRIQKERGDASELPPFEDIATGYGLTPARLAKLPPHAVIMHPGPVNRGLEIADELVTHPRSRIERQVANGVYARMAVLERVLRGLERPLAGRAR
ncbi:MAG TPA: aspartate carbamoyltransferase catalytic subunit [Candidatus Eremiobacteraceae bacterium]|nr:aspartate carbamoyltransferase catalytic subunit [Candidatus Eremiobacteraceae bacterium]